MKVAGYVRVSTDDQAEHGLSLDEQSVRIRAYVDLYRDDLSLVEIVRDEGWSGGTLTRPGMQRVLASFDRGEIGGVVAVRLDRLTRSTADLLALLQRFEAGGLITIDERFDTRTASGRMTSKVLAVVAEFQRELAAEQTSRVLQARRARNQSTGCAPYGKQLASDGQHTPRCARAGCPGCLNLEPHPQERRMLSEMRQLRDRGLTLREIAKWFNHMGRTTRRGSQWTHQAIHHHLRRNEHDQEG